MTINLMKMADKYNFPSLYDTIDSHFAQYYAQLLPSEKAEAKHALKVFVN